MSFGMALDNNIRDVDRTFESGGIEWSWTRFRWITSREQRSTT